MRLIDADDVDNHIVGSVNLSGCPTINAIPIPEDATNGDVIKAIFPNFHTDELSHTVWVGYDDMSFRREWWDAPYNEVGMVGNITTDNIYQEHIPH